MTKWVRRPIIPHIMLKRAKQFAKITLLTLLTFGIYFGVIQVDGNIHETVPGELYRSAQLSPDELTNTIHRYGIKSVINLRGENVDTKWYQNEIATTAAAGATHINFRMSAKRMLPEEKARELIEVMRNAPKPVLVHCQAGADRSGMASALYVAAIKNGSYAEAKAQLSPLYGHLPIPHTAAYAMTESFEGYKPMLGYQTE